MAANTPSKLLSTVPVTTIYRQEMNAMNRSPLPSNTNAWYFLIVTHHLFFNLRQSVFVGVGFECQGNER